MKNPGLSAVLSFIFPGAGQIYNGNIGKGIVIFLLAIVFAVLSMMLIGIPLLIILIIYSVYDAYKTANRLNEESGGAA